MALSIFKRRFLIQVYLAGGLLATSCGGSGGGSTPPPPPANAAPVVQVAADNANPDEGQPFSIDARGSSDPENSALTFSISQTSGTAANNNPDRASADGLWNYLAPEVTGNQNIVFSISVSDGQNTTTQSLTITATDIVLTPVSTFMTTKPTSSVTTGQQGANGPNVFIDNPQAYRSISWQDYNIENVSHLFILDTAAEGSDKMRLSILEQEGGGSIGARQSVDIDVPPGSTAKLVSGPFPYPQLEPMGAAIVFPDLDKIFTLIADGGDAPNFEIKQTLPVDSPCDAVFAPVHDTHANSDFVLNSRGYTEFAMDMVVGHEGQGLKAYIHNAKRDDSQQGNIGEFGDAIISLNARGAYCDLNNLTFSTSALATPTNNILGIDFDGGTFSAWNWATTTYEANIVPPGQAPNNPPNPFLPSEKLVDKIDLDVPAGLEIVAASSAKFRDSTTGKEAIVIVAAISDGNHDGDHGVITYSWYAGEDPMTEGTRQEMRWEKGVPTDVLLTRLKPQVGNPSPDVVVALGTAPYFAVLPNSVEIRSGNPFQFSGPEYAKAPLGMTTFTGPGIVVPSDDTIYSINVRD